MKSVTYGKPLKNLDFGDVIDFKGFSSRPELGGGGGDRQEAAPRLACGTFEHEGGGERGGRCSPGMLPGLTGRQWWQRLPGSSAL